MKQSVKIGVTGELAIFPRYFSKADVDNSSLRLLFKSCATCAKVDEQQCQTVWVRIEDGDWEEIKTNNLHLVKNGVKLAVLVVGASTELPYHSLALLFGLTAAKLAKSLEWSTSTTREVGFCSFAKSFAVNPSILVKQQCEPLTDRTRELVQSINRATTEKEVQEPALELVKLLLKPGRPVYILDTHQANYYRDPIAMTDVSLSSSPYVSWPCKISGCEFQDDLEDGTSHDTARGQAVDRFGKILAMQPGREKMLFLLMGCKHVELLLLQADQRHYATGLLPLEPQETSAGYQALNAFINADFDQFGYRAPDVPPSFKSPNAPCSAITNMQAVAGAPSKRRVFIGKYGHREQVVIKLGNGLDTEIQVLKKFQGVRGFPELLDSGSSPPEVSTVMGSNTFLVLAPFGRMLSKNDPPDLVVRVFQNVATALKAMHEAHWLYRDPSPSHIIHHQGQGYLIDHHVARSTDGQGSPHVFPGRVIYQAIRQYGVQEHTVTTDLEGTFYCLVDAASDGMGITWRHWGVDTHMLYAAKFTAMFSRNGWDAVLAHCRIELHGLLNKLHDLFFAGSHREYAKREVTDDAFLATLSSHYEA